MWFVDHAQITVHAGDGGRGCTAFSQPPYTRNRRPDGGNGGDGGNVVIRADPNLATLLDFHFRHVFRAGRGRHGSGNRKAGGRGEDCLIRVPLGTLVYNTADGRMLKEVIQPGDEFIAAKAGRGGAGNATLKEATPGTPGEQVEIRLELKLIADVGIVGAPNAGKSSLLARISTARPKVGAYPFTTRYPVLGVVNLEHEQSCVACDIPGLIEGAHEGRGLGIEFLRHIERTRLLLHVVDMAGEEVRDPFEAFQALNHELDAYSQLLRAKVQMIVANKMDLPQARNNLRRFSAKVEKQRSTNMLWDKIWPVSCATGVGIGSLLQALAHELQNLKQQATGK